MSDKRFAFPLSKQLDRVLERARNEATRVRNEYLTLEHALWAIVNDGEGWDILYNCGCEREPLQEELENYLSSTLEKVATWKKYALRNTLALDRVLQTAYGHVRSSGRDDISIGDFLAALMYEDESHAVYLLQVQGVTRLDILNYISHGVAKRSSMLALFEGAGQQPGEPGPEVNALRTFCTNLTELADQGEIDPIIGRERELRRMQQILCRRRKNNPILVGDPGVGKTALVEGLALLSVQGKVAAALKNIEIFLLDIGGIVAGASYKGEVEARIKTIISQIMKRPKPILAIDEVHLIVGDNSTGGLGNAASAILNPLLNSGQLRCIASTTYDQYKKLFDKDNGFSRRFQKVEVNEPTVSEAVKILIGLKSRYEDHHHVTYAPETILAAVELSSKHIADRFLPDKALDVLDEAGALHSLDREDEATPEKRPVISIHDVERVVADIAKVPLRSVTTTEREALKNIERDLLSVVFGQDEAIRTLAQAIKRNRAGLSRDAKPVGSFLLTGPTGVGKTEVAKQLANTLGAHFVRFDMSEYMEKHTVSRFIGAPPGYVGYDEGGQLTDVVRRHPYSVVLLDEIEKAHADVFNVLLQVMDNASLTDNKGVKADFRNVILLMTSNAGGREVAERSIGFDDTSTSVQRGKSLKAIENSFSPEFRNRLDRILVFNPLPREVVGMIVDKFMNQLRENLARKKVTLIVSNAAREWFSAHGYDKTFGARPLGRLIQQKVEDRLSEEILFGKLEKGGEAVVEVENDDIKLIFKERVRNMLTLPEKGEEI